MITLIVSMALAGGTYVPAASGQLTVSAGKKVDPCYPAAPRAEFAVSGPAHATIVLYVDLPRYPPKPKAVGLTVELDGKAKAQRLRPRRAAKARYLEVPGREPSAPSKPIKVAIPAGEHTLSVTLPRAASGCVVLKGLSLRVSEPEAMPRAEVPSQPPAPQPPVTTAQPTTDLPREEILATPVGASDVLTTEMPANNSTTASSDRLRAGLLVGGVLPRAELEPGFSLGLMLELPLSTLGLPGRFELGLGALELALHLGVGWSPMRQQDKTLIPGRGQTELIQNSLVIPLDLGVTLRLDVGAPVVPYVAVAVAAEIVRTELRAFSTEPVQENDFAYGAAGAVGVYAPLGPGGLLAELRYREVGADLGELSDVGESTLSAAALQLGYVVAF